MMKKDSLLLNLPNISPLQDSDEQVYELFFSRESQLAPFVYGNSWAYICQAARYQPLKFYDNESLITISNSRTAHGPLRLIRPVGGELPEKIRLLCNAIRTVTNQPILISKLRYKDYSTLKSFGFEEPKWKPNILEETPDDIYPQPICELDSYFEDGDICPHGNKLSKLRGKISRFRKYEIDFRFESLSQERIEDALTALRSWKTFFVKRYARKKYLLPTEDSYYYDPYKPLIEKLASRIDNHNYFSLICYTDDTPVGLSLLARISDVAVAQYINICSNYYKGLSEFLALSTFRQAFQAGFKYVNLGGSETRTLFEYNQKFAPERYEYDYYLVF